MLEREKIRNHPLRNTIFYPVPFVFPWQLLSTSNKQLPIALFKRDQFMDRYFQCVSLALKHSRLTGKITDAEDEAMWSK